MPSPTCSSGATLAAHLQPAPALGRPTLRATAVPYRVGPAAWVAGFDEAADTLEAMMPEPRSEERALRSKFMLIFRGGAVARHDLSPSELQAHVEKWYRWSDELARQGRRNAGTALDNPGPTFGGHRRWA